MEFKKIELYELYKYEIYAFCVTLCSKANFLLCILGTGTFGRVVLVRSKESKEYLALKVMAITEVIRLKQIEHVKNEKEILATISHPFIVNM